MSYICIICVCAIYVHQSSFRHLSKHRRTFNDSPTPRTFNGLGPLLRIQDDQVHPVADICIVMYRIYIYRDI